MRRTMARMGFIALSAVLLGLATPSEASGGVRFHLHFSGGHGFHPHHVHRFHHPKFVFPPTPFHHSPGFSLHFRRGPGFRPHSWHPWHHPHVFVSPFGPHPRW